MSTFRRAVVIVATLGGSAFAAPAPITNPDPLQDPSRDPAVVALAFGQTVICSGTIIAKHAVLTAAHCLTDTSIPDVVEGTNPATGTHHRSIARFLHPDFDPDTLDHDVAILVVDSPFAMGRYEWASALPAGLKVGDTMRIVGYGWTVANDPLPPMQRGGTTKIDTIDELRITAAPSPSQACEGDSGGPALVAATIVGVTSSGDTACTQFARHTRVDTHAAWIADVVARTAPGAAQPGERCLYDGNCSYPPCLPATDDPRLSFCSPPCDADNACPDGLACFVEDGSARCRHPWPSPGADRSACTAADDCASGYCLAAAGETETVCTRHCFSDLPGFDCPVNTVCRAAADGSEGCFAIDTGGGCQVAPGHDRGALVIIAMLGGTVLLRRRRR